MNVSYELTSEDVLALYEFHQKSSPAIRTQRLGCVAGAVIALLILPVGMVMATEGSRIQTAIDVWPLFLGPIVFAVVALPYIRWRSRRLLRRMLREGQNSGAYGKCDLILGRDAITESRAAGATTRAWSSVERIVVTARHLFIYTSGVEAFVIPRRAFGTQSEFEQLVGEAAERAGITVEQS